MQSSETHPTPDDAGVPRFVGGPAPAPASENGHQQPSANPRAPSFTRRTSMAAFENPEELASLPLFAGISLDSLRRLNERLGRLYIPTGRVLMSAEQPGEM